MSVARAFYYLAPLSQLGKVVDPLLRLLPISFETERAVLPSLFIIVCDAPVSRSAHADTNPVLLYRFLATFPSILSALHHSNFRYPRSEGEQATNSVEISHN